MASTCPKCSGSMEPAVVSGVVSLKRQRTFLASGKVSALRAEVCVRCGHADLYAERPERLFSDIVRDDAAGRRG